MLKPAPPPRGVLRRGVPDGVLHGDRVMPPDALSPFVHHFSSLRWDLDTPFVGEALAHPAARIWFELASGVRSAEITGVQTARLSKSLTGRGRVFGITFRPATFQSLLGAPMSSLTDRAVPIGHVFGSEGDAFSRKIFAARSLERQIAVAQAFLARRLRPLPPDVQRLRDVVEHMASDRALTRVEDLAEVLELDVRSLQRHFRRYVGVSPKWVIRRYRLHEAAEQLKGPHPPTLAALAASLGYADQAHFARDFKLTIGRTPRAFCLSDCSNESRYRIVTLPRVAQGVTTRKAQAKPG